MLCLLSLECKVLPYANLTGRGRCRSRAKGGTEKIAPSTLKPYSLTRVEGSKGSLPTLYPLSTFVGPFVSQAFGKAQHPKAIVSRGLDNGGISAKVFLHPFAFPTSSHAARRSGPERPKPARSVLRQQPTLCHDQVRGRETARANLNCLCLRPVLAPR